MSTASIPASSRQGRKGNGERNGKGGDDDSNSLEHGSKRRIQEGAHRRCQEKGTGSRIWCKVEKESVLRIRRSGCSSQALEYELSLCAVENILAAFVLNHLQTLSTYVPTLHGCTTECMRSPQISRIGHSLEILEIDRGPPGI